MDPIVTWLLTQGPTGIMAVVVMMLWRENKRLNEARITEGERHREEMNVLIERHLIRSEKWADKGTAIAEKLAGRHRRLTAVEGDK